MRNAIMPLTLLLLGFTAAHASDQGIKGVWFRGDGKAKVKIEDCGGDICAINLWIKPGTKGEKAGDRLIMDIKPEGRGRFEGEARDPQRGLTYNIEIKAGDAAMTTRGCILAHLLCKSVHWSRVQ